MKMQRFVVAFDNGDRFECQPTSRDLLSLERAGIDLEQTPGLEGTYRIAHTVLARLERTDQIAPTDPIPETWEGLADVADLEVEDAGEASGQEATTGS